MEKNEVLPSLPFPGVTTVAVLVSTALGPLWETDLEVRVVPQYSDPSGWCVAVEGRYVGKDPALAAYVGKIVRRSVWVDIKHGQAMTGEQG